MVLARSSVLFHTMPILVQKYGGSSVADVARIALVADRVTQAKRAGHDVVVVVSAMGKTTDQLLVLAREIATACKTKEGFAPPRRELDMLVSTGERVTMALLSIAIQARGHEAISFTGSQSGILTNDRHFDARILEVRPHRVEDELARGKIVIVAGYQGMSYKREITTLGRGGSDTTAVALAAALGAQRCEIYSDVDGIYSADPRVVPDAVHLPEVDLASLQEMAESGAKVMNAQAVEWARHAKITLHARRTSDPLDADGAPPRETIARERTFDDGQPTRRVRAVVGMDRVVHVTLPAAKLRSVAEHAASLELPLLDVGASGSEACATIPLLNVPDWDTRRGRLEAALEGALSLEEGLAMVSVVGDGLTTRGESRASFPAFLDALGPGARRRVVAGPLRMSGLVPSARLDETQRALHERFVGDTRVAFAG
jgi:aspartate kinase